MPWPGGGVAPASNKSAGAAIRLFGHNVLVAAKGQVRLEPSLDS